MLPNVVHDSLGDPSPGRRGSYAGFMPACPPTPRSLHGGQSCPDPIVFISHFQIRDGAVDTYRQLQREVASDLEAAKPRTLVFLTYVDTASSQMTAVHVFADADSMDLHFEGSDERSAAAYEFLQLEGVGDLREP